MSYSIELCDPVSGDVLQLDTKHEMRGGTYALGGTTEAELNITYNYANYYYECTDGDKRFAHEEISARYADGTDGPIETQYGIRGIYGKSGAESIPMLRDMISRIEAKYKKDGEWIKTQRERTVFYDKDGKQIDAFEAIVKKMVVQKEEYVETISEGPNEDYWEATAGNAIRPLYQLIALAQLRPDGVWRGD